MTKICETHQFKPVKNGFFCSKNAKEEKNFSHQLMLSFSYLKTILQIIVAVSVKVANITNWNREYLIFV
jgi:hypothetical protein